MKQRVLNKVSQTILYSLIILLNINYYGHIKCNNIDIIESSTINNDFDNYSQLINTIKEHISLIDFKLEECIQAINNNIIHINNKDTLNKIIKLKNYINRTEANLNNDSKQIDLSKVISINNKIINVIKKAYQEDINLLSKLDLKLIDQNILSNKSNNLNNISKDYNKYNSYMNVIENKLKGLLDLKYKEPKTRFNRYITNTNNFLEDYHIKKAIIKSLPYLGALSLWVVNTEDEKLPPNLKSFKYLILSPFKRIYKQEPNLDEPIQDAHSKDQEKNKYRNTSIGNISDMLKKGKVIGLDPKPMITIPIATGLGKLILSDIKSCRDYFCKKSAKIWQNAKGEKIKNSSPIIQANPKFNFNDIIGYNDIKDSLEDTIYYYKHQEDLKNTGAYVQKAYILSGPITISNKIVKAIAGQLSNDTQNKWGIFTVTASTLQDKRLKDLIKDNKSKTPFILVLKDLKALVANTNFNNKVLSNLLEDIDNIIKDKSNKIIVSALTEDANDLNSLLKEHGRLDKTINVILPEYNQRLNYINNLFNKNGLSINDFNIESLAKYTEDYIDIDILLNKAQARAYCNKERLSQAHFDKLI